MSDITPLDYSDSSIILPLTKELRKLLIQAIYSSDYVASVVLSSNQINEIIQYVFEVNCQESDDQFVADQATRTDLEKYFTALLAATSSIDNIIAQYLRADWHMSRIARVILSILRVATFEFYQLKFATKYEGYNRIIRDYLEIAKSMGHKREVQFIQGIINKIIQNIEIKH